MLAPGFWSLPKPTLLARLLSPFGWMYGGISAARMRSKGVSLNVPVICIGNFTLGGAGKTPTASAIANLLRNSGQKPMFVSRGYGGALSGKTPVLVEPEKHASADVGDEPLLLARIAPCFICQDRVAAAKAAIAAGATLIILDDGLQNPSLVKTVSIAVIDNEVGVGNGLTFPAGPLRAPLRAQLPRVDAILSVGAGEADSALLKRAARRHIPVFHGQLVPDAAIAAGLNGQRVFAFAGIGRPEKFFATLRATGAEIAATQSFPDHHQFSQQDMTSLARIAKERGIIPVTTEKDAMRLSPEMRNNVVALPVTLHINNADQLLQLIRMKCQ